ncbi:MAG: pyruvate, water dikinase regulatory protein [Albimonas sp.]|uniref:pyruvate, water dikinase regulatory protein n=1 Tax=Albimonas sp. TaxID=1872425 RepID=UPI0040565375
MTQRSARHVLHLLSDSTGETVSAAAGAVISQFEGLELTRRIHVFARSRREIDQALDAIAAEPGLVAYTLLDEKLAEHLRAGCARIGVPAVALLDPFFRALTEFVGAQRGKKRPGRQHDVDLSYFDRVSAIDYAMAHDDGATSDRLMKADVILVGVSRTSKTPTCLYLAVRGVKAANVPLVPGASLPKGLETAIARGIPTVGLIASPSRLVQVRGQRLEAIGAAPGMNSDAYADPERVREEVSQARLLFDRLGLPVIDVTRRSIEETAASILAILRAQGAP